MPRHISWIATLGVQAASCRQEAERQRPQRAMRRDGNVIGLGHRGDLAAFEDAAGVAQVRLDDVDRAGSKNGLKSQRV